MNKVARITVGSLAYVVGFAQSALAGANYDSNPVVTDSGSDAGVFLLLALGGLIVIKSVASPAPSTDAEIDPDKTE